MTENTELSKQQNHSALARSHRVRAGGIQCSGDRVERGQMKPEKLDPRVSEFESAKETKLQQSHKPSPYRGSLDGVPAYNRNSFPQVSKQ